MSTTALYTAASGMQAAMEEINVRANNLANANSVGYQTLEVETKDRFYTKVTRAGVAEAQDVSLRPVGVEIGSGATVTGTYRKLTQGTLNLTNNPLDVAIIGAGYFAVTLPNNVRGFTRSGAFKLDNQRQIVTAEGYPLEVGITLPADVNENTLSITPQGDVYGVDGGGNRVNLGTIPLYTFANAQGLDTQGNGYLIETDASGDAEELEPGVNGAGQLAHRQREMSNVVVADEFVKFMAAQQVYDMSSRVMRAVDEMIKELKS